MKRLCTLAFALICVPVLAGPFDGVFVSDPQGCQWLEQDGAMALFDNDFLALTRKDGIVANEYHCEFLDEKTTADGVAMVITALCEYPGEPFPDLISLREFDENSIMVSSMHNAAEDAANDVQGIRGAQIYTRCSNLKELPID